MNWTDERVELLRKLWADGLSASQIAAQMGGVSRNAVIGKVHRLKLSGRGKQTSSQPRVKKPAASGISYHQLPHLHLIRKFCFSFILHYPGTVISKKRLIIFI